MLFKDDLSDYKLHFDYDEIIDKTDKAALFLIDGEKEWLPLSQIITNEKKMVVEVPEWLAKTKGWI